MEINQVKNLKMAILNLLDQGASKFLITENAKYISLVEASIIILYAKKVVEESK